MAGKKGRSGRKPASAKKITPAATPGSVSNAVQTQPETGLDPLKALEDRIRIELPMPGAGETAQPAAPAQIKPPENLARLFWNGFYSMEDFLARWYLGLSEDEKGIFCDEALIESHVKPTCDILVKYIPAEKLSEWEKNAPEAALGIAFVNVQAGILMKLRQIKSEMGTKKPVSAPQPAQTSVFVPRKPGEQVINGYPTKDQL